MNNQCGLVNDDRISYCLISVWRLRSAWPFYASSFISF